jgi:hypothetical protein
MQVDEIRNAGTDGVGWTERVACCSDCVLA